MHRGGLAACAQRGGPALVVVGVLAYVWLHMQRFFLVVQATLFAREGRGARLAYEAVLRLFDRARASTYSRRAADAPGASNNRIREHRCDLWARLPVIDLTEKKSRVLSSLAS